MPAVNYQGGKAFGQLKERQSYALDEVNAQFLRDGTFDTTSQDLKAYKEKFMTYDIDHSGGIDKTELHMMLEKLGTPKSHLEVKKMLTEVDRDSDGVIGYVDFLYMMLGKTSSILQRILMFESLSKKKEVPKGRPAKLSLDQLLARDAM